MKSKFESGHTTLQKQIDLLKGEIEGLNDRFDKYLIDKLKSQGYEQFPQLEKDLREEKAKKFRTNW